jgi:hypothetical protein
MRDDQDAIQCGSVRQSQLSVSRQSTCFISRFKARRSKYRQVATKGGHGLLTSGSQVRVLLGSTKSRLTARPAATFSLKTAILDAQSRCDPFSGIGLPNGQGV